MINKYNFWDGFKRVGRYNYYINDRMRLYKMFLVQYGLLFTVKAFIRDQYTIARNYIEAKAQYVHNYFYLKKLHNWRMRQLQGIAA